MLPGRIDLPIEKLPGVGEKLKHSFYKLGINNLKELIYFLPRKVLDLRRITTIEKAKTLPNQEVVIRATVKSCSIIKSRFKRMWIVEALLEDDSGAIEAVWFNQPFIHKSLKKGEEYFFYGDLGVVKNKIFLNNSEVHIKSGIFPIYRQSQHLSSKRISNVIQKILKPSLFPADLIPEKIKKQNNLFSLFKAAKAVHSPVSLSQFNKGRFRFLFEELFIFALTNQFIKREFLKEKSFVIQVNKESLQKMISRLPYKLTRDQEKALSEIADDFKRKNPMNRLIQGDVGSGKTIIAFLAAALAAENGYKVALMAPTEILASQHFETFSLLKKNLKINNFNIAYVTGKKKIISDNSNVLIGTQALLNRQIDRLALIIVDEQQRFGVGQRNLLVEKNKLMPHYLSLSATPIPRSLAHVIFANCDLSIVKEKPPGRVKIRTYLIPEEKRQDTYKFIDSIIEKGQQAFVICPLIEMTDFSSDKKSVEMELSNLKKTALGKRKLAILHGRQSSAQKEEIMTNFKDRKIDILISTSVVEVGIDIPNATAMIIEDAESFGLSQLHQFRGRIGRGKDESYCFVFSKKIENSVSKERLKAFVQNDDGFNLANLDLKLRGPGAFFGSVQSGFSTINPLWFEDSQLLEEATLSAKIIAMELENYPELNNEIRSRVDIKHLE